MARISGNTLREIRGTAVTKPARFDDTNPEAEEEIYFTSIINVVEWLGMDIA